MICLTGDLHHMSLKTGNQEHCDITEMQTAILFLNLLKQYDIKMTYFITGKSFVEEWHDVKQIVFDPLVEVGGHNYDAFENEFVHRVWNKLTKNYNGPKWMQRQDALKTISIIKEKTGKDIKVWRNHMYMHGANTEEVLADVGIQVCSDGVKKESNIPVLHKTGILNFPINIIPDHEHLIHAERTPTWIAQWQKRYNWSDDFGKESYYIEQWSDMVIEQLKQREEQGLVSNVIIHPITMYLCDGFKEVKRILEYICTCKTVHMSELIKAKS
jgi:peptidoglycan/xylan/chitin deacetylase (PgdA/CDA1 family)